MKMRKINYEPLSLIMIGVLILTIIVVFFTYSSSSTTRQSGYELKPTKVIQIKGIQYYSQIDSRWSQIILGNSDETIKQSGCLLTSLANALFIEGEDTNPAELNELFTQNSVYTDTGLLIWYRIGRALDGITYDYVKTPTVLKIENDMANGRVPIVEVKNKKTGTMHFVNIVGSDGNEFLIIDPKDGDPTPVGLKRYGDVYSYWTVYRLN